MSLIEINEYGAVAVNNKVIINLIGEKLLSMSNVVTLCNKKGKPIKDKNSAFIGHDFSDCIDFKENKNGTYIRIFLITKATSKVSAISENIIDEIETVFLKLNLKKPLEIVLVYKEIMSMQFDKKGVEVIRKND